MTVRIRRSRGPQFPVDPTQVRLSKHFLLSDFMGCHSVYSKGYQNVFLGDDSYKLEEAKYLAKTVLEQLIKHSPVSISYGYISYALAKKIVVYQSPDKPSYHQWNDGAACDLIMHKMDHEDVPPIYVAQGVDADFPMSRVITYSESPFICVATRKREQDAPRKAFYENRYTGKSKVKPQFVTIPKDRNKFFLDHQLKHDWRGAGYPTYHGGGARQAQHIRVGKYNMLSDFLYSTIAINKGYKNYPTVTDDMLNKFRHVANVYASLLDKMKVKRLNIVKAFESGHWSKNEEHTWTGDRFSLQLKLPEGCKIKAFNDAARSIEDIDSYACVPHKELVIVSGFFNV